MRLLQKPKCLTETFGMSFDIGLFFNFLFLSFFQSRVEGFELYIL